MFSTTKLRKEFNDQKLLVRKQGPERAKLIMLRLTQLAAANNLEALRFLPQVRCHELKGSRAGQLSLDIGQPYRLIVEPANVPVPQKRDGGLDWTKVTKVRILEIADTHG